MSAATAKPVIFISYSHKDEPDPYLQSGEVQWLSYVRSFLKPAEAHGTIELWDDRRIDGGGDWRADINDALERCTVCVFLVSRHSLSSRFILDTEIKRMLERHHARGAHLYPIVITSTDLGAAPWLLKLNLRPPNGRALNRYDPGTRDEVMAELAAEIRNIIERFAHDASNLASADSCDYSKRTACKMHVNETNNPVPLCVELLPGTTQGSAYEQFDMLPEIRCGIQVFQVDNIQFSIGVTQLQLKLILKDCNITPGTRLGDKPHSDIRAQGGNTWVITGPLENETLVRRVIGSDILCAITPAVKSIFNVTMEVGCLQMFVRHNIIHKQGGKLDPAKERILGVFINQCIGFEDGFIKLCRSDFDVMEVTNEA